jgi:hypothetical protein
MSGCGDLCTAQECRILQQQIDQLWRYIHNLEDRLSNRLGNVEQAVELLEASFEAHTNQDIPQAHNYEPNVQVALATDTTNNTLKVFVKVGDQSDDETITLPEQNSEVEVALATDSTNNTLKVFVKVGDQSDDETITLPTPLVQVDAAVENEDLAINVQVGENYDIAIVKLPIPEIIKGIDGRDGQDGRNGEDGRDGRAGKDALDILADFAKFLAALEAAKGFLQDLIRDVIGDLINELLDRLLENLMRNLNLQLLFDNGLLTANLSANGAFTSDSVNIDMELVPIQVEQVTCINRKLEIKSVSVAVIKGTEAAELEAYASRANILKTQCELEVVAAVPEWWQSRIGSARPQLIIIYEDASKSKWSLSLPWYRGGYGSKIIELIPSYTKGNYNTTLTLADNSKVVVNAASKMAGETFIKKISQLIEPKQLKGAELKSGGERRGKIKQAKVTPLCAKYFSTGQKDMLPDWKYSFKTKKYFKYDRGQK